MIISHKYKFIFLKTKKTAGTSIEIALSHICGPEDVITPFGGRGDGEPPAVTLGFRGAQNFKIDKISDSDFFGQNEKRFYNHISARKVKWFVESDVWESYYKFCVERNPWDRLVSLYFWNYRSEPRPTFSDFLKSTAPLRAKAGGFDLYTLDGEVAVDRICRFEHLESDLEQVRLHLGLPEPIILPRAKSDTRPTDRDYRSFYSIEDREKVGEFFAKEIAMFGYEF